MLEAKLNHSTCLEYGGELVDRTIQVQCLVQLLRKHRPRLFPFLYVAGVAPTHNAAERAFRPAVIVRKTSAGNCGWPGARVHAVVTSLWQTRCQPGRDFLDMVTTLWRSPQPRVVELVPLGTSATGPP